LTIIIDRRENPSGKSLPNRQRFLRRAKEHLKEAVRKKVSRGNVTDIIDGDRKVEISGKSLEEYRFVPDRATGSRDIVVPGNKSFRPGDVIDKNPPGSSGSGRDPGDGEDYDDSFLFTLTRDELVGILFDGLELPNLEKTTQVDARSSKFSRAGLTTSGSPVNLDLIRTMRNSLGRRIALKRPTNGEIEELEKKIAEGSGDTAALEAELKALLARKSWVPFVDPIDARYRSYEEKPQPIAAAVMFCVMDVSGSMGEREKDIAKRFFMLLHLFLTSKYEKVSVVFIRHTTSASEVDENEFFYGTVSGGTTVLPAIELALKIQRERFPTTDWNVYCAQVSDGGIDLGDASKTCELVKKSVASAWKYFAYVEISDPQSVNLFGLTWTHMIDQYDSIGSPTIKTAKVRSVADIYPVFRDLFSKESAR